MSWVENQPPEPRLTEISNTIGRNPRPHNEMKQLCQDSVSHSWTSFSEYMEGLMLFLFSPWKYPIFTFVTDFASTPPIFSVILDSLHSWWRWTSFWLFYYYYYCYFFAWPCGGSYGYVVKKSFLSHFVFIVRQSRASEAGHSGGLAKGAAKLYEHQSWGGGTTGGHHSRGLCTEYREFAIINGEMMGKIWGQKTKVHSIFDFLLPELMTRVKCNPYARKYVWYRLIGEVPR